jgi:hypothetical protein
VCEASVTGSKSLCGLLAAVQIKAKKECFSYIEK